MPGRIVLLVTSPRLPAGLLSAAAWDVVRACPVLAGAQSEATAALRAAGVDVGIAGGRPVDELLAAVATGASVVWLAGPAGDESLARELGLRLARQPGLAELELMYGSWDPPGARLLDAVAVLDRLLSPGGDPWKRAQTHRSLAPYLLEECYEAYDAIHSDDPLALRDELGDVLLQVVLHARLAQESSDDRQWSIEDVAAGLVDKMIRRNPHVFSDDPAETLAEITENWERIKRAERTSGSAMDGIVLAQPALSLAAKILHRAERSGVRVPLPGEDVAAAPGEIVVAGLGEDVAAEPGEDVAAERGDAAGAADPKDVPALADGPRALAEENIGARLLRLVAQARAAGVDAEGALRRVSLAYADAVRAAEERGGSGAAAPGH